MTAARTNWVVCHEYAYGPFTPARAERRRELADKSGDCRYPHKVVCSQVRPTTEAELDTLLAERESMFLDAEPGDPDWRETTLELAAAWLNAPQGMSAADGLTVADDQPPPRESVTLTSDGSYAAPSSWCRCSPEPDMDGWVQYERWSERGREAHGFVCRSCRRLLQSG
jgi:hypothetical protein